MSMPICEKIMQIREELGLTRLQFANEIDVSVNTLKSIEQKSVIPRSDIIEKIAVKWPDYANWILLGTTALNKRADELDRYRIIDSTDARFMNQCIIKSSAFNKLIFIQSAENPNDLACLLIIDTDIMYRISWTPNIKAAVWVQPGNMSFESSGGGRNVLRDFRRWIKSFNTDLIDTAELRNMDARYFDEVYRQLHVRLDLLMKPDESGHIYKKFIEWKAGEGY